MVIRVSAPEFCKFSRWISKIIIYKDLGVPGPVADNECSSPSMSDSESSHSDDKDACFFSVKCREPLKDVVEQDVLRARCLVLRKLMRQRPCLPSDCCDVESGAKLSIYSCPYKDCCFHSNDRTLFLHHVLSTGDGL